MNVIDLFCGCGGLSLGFEQAGYKVLLGIDNWEDSLVTFRYNHHGSETMCADLMNLNPMSVEERIGNKKVDVIIGGPPCQGFSVAGKVNTVNGATFMVLGDAELKRQGLCLVTDIDPDVKLEPGMEIVTSGDGGLFPEGIPIGVIESVDDSNPLQITATLRPYSQIGKLEDVFIMIPYVEESPEETAVPTT